MSRTTSLLEENYKYGSMPTHPLGAAVAFHAGTIGEGKRRPERALPYSSDAVDFNQFTFVTLLFKICHSSTRAASSPPVPASASAEQKAHQGLYSVFLLFSPQTMLFLSSSQQSFAKTS